MTNHRRLLHRKQMSHQQVTKQKVSKKWHAKTHDHGDIKDLRNFVIFLRSLVTWRRRKRKQSLRAQASKPLYPHHVSNLHYTDLLELPIQHFTPTSGSLQLCSEVINNILIVPEFIQSRLKCVIGGISRNNPVMQTIPYIDHSDKKTVFSWVVFNTKLFQLHTANYCYQ